MKNILLLFFLGWQLTIVAQEDINLQFDKNFYVLGETIWYSAYLIAENSTAQKANMLRIELVAKDGQVQQRNNLLLENGIAKGHIAIPLDWEEGWYTFHAYTVWSPNPTIKNSATVNIPIYDDFKSHQEVESVMNKAKKELSSSLACTVKTNKNEYERRATITLDLGTQALNEGTISVAVLPKEMLTATNSLIPTKANFSTTENQKPEALHASYGQIEMKENGKKTLGVGVHYIEDNQLQWTSADEKGVFSTVNKLGVAQQVQIFGLFNNQNQTYTEALSSQELNFTQSLTTKYQSGETLGVNSYIKKYLTQSQQRKKYQEIFGLEKAMLTNVESVDKQRFQPDAVYNLDDYASMTSLEEFLTEVIPFIKIKTKKGKPVVRMFNELKVFTDDAPIYLVDNWLTYDQEAILNIPIAAIESISLYRTTTTLKSQFGVLGNEGVIGIKTKQKERSKIIEKLTNIMPVQGIAKAMKFSTLKASFKQMPDFRPLIYWNADVLLKDGKAQITFPHSDDLGEFVIRVKGMTKDGELLEGSGTYLVK